MFTFLKTAKMGQLECPISSDLSNDDFDAEKTLQHKTLYWQLDHHKKEKIITFNLIFTFSIFAAKLLTSESSSREL